MEAAANCVSGDKIGEQAELAMIETPDCKTIEDVCAFLHSDVESSCKAVVYQKASNGQFAVGFWFGSQRLFG